MAVVRASLIFDAVALDFGEPAELDYALRLDLRTADGTSRAIHWKDTPGQALYPEEAFGAPLRWAPGTSRSIYLLRGDAESVRRPGGSDFHERTAEDGCFARAFFWPIGIVIVWALLADRDVRFLRAWRAFVAFGGMLLLVAVLFVSARVPRILDGPNTLTAIRRRRSPRVSPLR